MIKEKGFTLIEILVVMAIISLVSVGSYVGFVQFNKQQSLTSVWDTLRNNLNEAKSKAASQVIVTSICNNGSQTLVGQQVRFYAPAGAPHYYNLEEVCNPGGVAIVRTVYLPSNVTFTTIPPPTSPLRFLIITGVVSNPTTITISNGSQARSIIIDRTGIIK